MLHHEFQNNLLVVSYFMRDVSYKKVKVYHTEYERWSWS